MSFAFILRVQIKILKMFKTYLEDGSGFNHSQRCI